MGGGIGSAGLKKKKLQKLKFSHVLSEAMRIASVFSLAGNNLTGIWPTEFTVT